MTNMHRFRIFWESADCFSSYEFIDFDLAVDFVKEKGFNALIYLGGEIVATWHVISGLHDRRTV